MLAVTRSSAARLDKAPLGTSQRTCDRLSTRTYALAAPVTGPASIELPAEAHGFKLMREEFVSEYDSKVAIYRCGPPETVLLPFERAPMGLVHAEVIGMPANAMPCWVSLINRPRSSLQRIFKYLARARQASCAQAHEDWR